MKTRVITAMIGLAVLALVFSVYSTPLFNIVLILVTLIGVHEVYNAFRLQAPHIFGVLASGVILIMMEEIWFPGAFLRPVLYAMYIVVLLLSCFVIARVNTLDFAKVCGVAVFSGMITACFYSFLYLRNFFALHRESVYLTVLILAFAWGADTCAYFTGSAFGRHKLAPQVSPHKTIEGAVGGIVGGVLLGIVITVVFQAIYGEMAFLHRYGIMSYLLVGAVGAVSSVLGIVGDLAASAVKRQCGIKDYGTIFPGHGGILDRFDSVIFIAPFVTMCCVTFLG